MKVSNLCWKIKWSRIFFKVFSQICELTDDLFCSPGLFDIWIFIFLKLLLLYLGKVECFQVCTNKCIATVEVICFGKLSGCGPLMKEIVLST